MHGQTVQLRQIASCCQVLFKILNVQMIMFCRYTVIGDAKNTWSPCKPPSKQITFNSPMRWDDAVTVVAHSVGQLVSGHWRKVHYRLGCGWFANYSELVCNSFFTSLVFISSFLTPLIFTVGTQTPWRRRQGHFLKLCLYTIVVVFVFCVSLSFHCWLSLSSFFIDATCVFQELAAGSSDDRWATWNWSTQCVSSNSRKFCRWNNHEPASAKKNK